MKRDTGYYPDTPLSLNHSLMKDKALRPSPEQPAALPQINYFGAKTFGTHASAGVKEVLINPAENFAKPLF